MIRHGEARHGRMTKEYHAWLNMGQRCHNKNAKNYKYYGARGIKVCDRWRESFLNFLDDMGRAPSPDLSVGRKDNDGNYEPSNCFWATRLEQAANKRGDSKAKLTVEIVAGLRAKPVRNAAVTAAHLGVTLSTLYKAIRGDTWKTAELPKVTI